LPTESTSPRVLLTSVCRPLGTAYGDGPSVGYEMLFGQVTRKQGVFSPRSNTVNLSLDFIAENLDAPTTVIHYPSRAELARELRRGYDYVGVSFVLATFHRMKEAVALIREHAPDAQIVLGGYGTVASDEELEPYGDHICREEGVGFMRRLLDEPAREMPYRHPLVVSRTAVLGVPASSTAMVFAGLGCPNGCDFCCTSHFFARRHIRLLPSGRHIYDVIARYLDHEPDLGILVYDEDFLLNRRRAMELRDCVLASDRSVSMFVFSSVRALSQYSVTEILEMGIDGVWIGYEGARSGYAKQQGRPIDELIAEFRAHGITVLTSMIVGLPYQTREVIEEELEGLLALRPALCQFLIYGPSPGTPFFDRIMREGLLRQDLDEDRELFYRRSTGFEAMVEHPTMSGAEIQDAQERCFQEDFDRLGPSIYRTVDTWLTGHLALENAEGTFLRQKSQRFATDARRAYPAFLAGRLFGPTRAARAAVGALQRRAHQILGPPTLGERLKSLAVLATAAWTGLALRFNLFQHPRLMRHTYRMPDGRQPARLWRRLRDQDPSGCQIEVELRTEATVWVQLEGRLLREGAERLAARLGVALRQRRERVILDLTRLTEIEREATHDLVERLHAYGDRIHVQIAHASELVTLTALFGLCRGGL